MRDPPAAGPCALCPFIAISSPHRCGVRGPAQNQLGWKKPLRSASSISDPTPPCQVQQGTERHVQSLLKHLQGWWLHHLSGEPIPRSNDPFCGGTSPDVQPKPPLVHLKGMFACPVLCSAELDTGKAAVQTQGSLRAPKATSTLARALASVTSRTRAVPVPPARHCRDTPSPGISSGPLT